MKEKTLIQINLYVAIKRYFTYIEYSINEITEQKHFDESSICFQLT